MAVPSTRWPLLSALLDGIAQVPAALDRPVTGLALDSRRVQPGEVFLACAGSHDHGLHYLQQARSAGAATILWEPPVPPDFEATAANLLPVPELGQQVGLMAARFYGFPASAMTVIGVTGTDGKTSCSHFLAQCLSEPDRPCGLIGTLGLGPFGHLQSSPHTTPDPLTLQQVLARFRDQGLSYVAMEASSHALAQGRARGIRFRVAVLTNLTRDHLDYHGDLEAYRAAKARLFTAEGLGAAVLNADDALGRELLLALDGRRIGYALENQVAARAADAYVLGGELALDSAGIDFQVESSWGKGRARSGLLGHFNAANLLAVLATLLELGQPLKVALRRLSRLRTAPGRMERFGGGEQPLVVVDYAHTPHALEQVLRALRGHLRGCLTCVFGCGGDRDRGKRPEMAATAERWADRLVITDDNPRTEDPNRIVADIRAGLVDHRKALVERDRGAAIRLAVTGARAGDVVLIAGKGHEDYQIVGERRLSFSDRAVVAALMGATS